MKEHDKKNKSKMNREIPLSESFEENKSIEEEHAEENKNVENKENEFSEIEKELSTLNEKIIELEKSNTELKDTLLRKVAEFENYKRRTENDQLNLLKYAAEPFIKNILPVYDNLEKSILHMNENNNFESLKKGVELIYENFTKILESQGVKKIQAKGKHFNVELHDALLQQPAEHFPPHTILEVVEEGYMYKDKVLRHSKVIVSSEAVQNNKENNESNNNPNE